MSSVRQKKAAEKKEAETVKAVAVQVDDLLTFSQFSKKSVDNIIDVCFFRNAVTDLS